MHPSLYNPANQLTMNTSTVRDQIVDAAINLAEYKNWESVRLHEVAIKLGLSLDDIRAEFSEKDQLVDAWFDRADSAMLTDVVEASQLGLSCQQRLHRAIMGWLNALSSHRRVTRQMILGKLEPGHFHIQIPGLIRISRTVQWMREAADYDASLPRRAIEESLHTGIFLATFSYWMFDDSFQSEHTGRFLQRQLDRVSSFVRCSHDQPSSKHQTQYSQTHSTEGYAPRGQAGQSA
jgi:AcrR family transcriptional regulator